MHGKHRSGEVVAKTEPTTRRIVSPSKKPMNLSLKHNAVLQVVRRQYPASITARSISEALISWRMKEREVSNLLNDLCKQGLVTHERPNGISYYTAVNKS